MESVRFLKRALESAELVPLAQSHLLRLASSEEATEVAAAASAVFKESAERQPLSSGQDIAWQREELESLEREREQRRMTTIHFSVHGEDDELRRHYEGVIRAILGGRIIPFLGAGVNLCGRPIEVKWSPGSGFLPSSWELAEYLARVFRYPHPPDDLLRVSQYVTITDGAGPLYDELHKLFDSDYIPTSLHRFLAALPSAMRAKGLPVKYPLIVTTNYDDVLEVALKQADEPYDLVYYESKGKNFGKFWHRPPDGKPQLIERPNVYRGLSLGRHTIVLKIHGAVTRAEPTGDRDSYVITEDNYIDYMLNTEVAVLLPIPLFEKLMRSHCLFLGYNLTSWNRRIILRRIWKDRAFSWKSWAVRRGSDAIDDQFWKSWNVETINADLQDYIAALSRCLENWPHAGAGA